MSEIQTQADQALLRWWKEYYSIGERHEPESTPASNVRPIDAAAKEAIRALLRWWEEEV